MKPCVKILVPPPPKNPTFLAGWGVSICEFLYSSPNTNKTKKPHKAYFFFLCSRSLFLVAFVSNCNVLLHLRIMTFEVTSHKFTFLSLYFIWCLVEWMWLPMMRKRTSWCNGVYRRKLSLEKVLGSYGRQRSFGSYVCLSLLFLLLLEICNST
jgi:hypothetical protein